MARRQRKNSHHRFCLSNSTRFPALSTARAKRRGACRILRIEQLEPRQMLAAYLVDTELDSIDPNDGQTSLREAITSANASTGSDTILFLTTISNKTISLTHGELPITDSLT